MRLNYKRLGEYIEPCDEKNIGNTIKKLQGISNQKYFQKAKTNIIGIDLSKYRVVRTGQFAFNRATTRNSDKISIALRHKKDCIVSPSYRIFKSKDENILNSEYLMMWFKRPEFDRYARFKSHGSAHEFFDYKEMCEVELPVPNIEKQKAIVKEYNIVTKRIQLNEQLNQKLEETAQALYKHWFVDFEFPDENGNPYKSSGGAMVYNEEMDGEIPEGWVLMELSEVVSTQYGYTERATEEEVGPKFLRITDIAQTHISWDSVPFCPITDLNFSKYELKRGDIVIARTGATVGYAKQMGRKIPKAVFASYLVRIIPNDPIHQFLLGMNIVSKEYREFVLSNAEGSAQPQANARLMTAFSIIVPDNFVVKEFNKLIIPFYDLKENNELQNQFLIQLQELLLSKMATVEN